MSGKKQKTKPKQKNHLKIFGLSNGSNFCGLGGSSLLCSSVGKGSDSRLKEKRANLLEGVLFHFFIPVNFSKQQYTHNLSFNLHQLSTDQKIPNHDLIRLDN